MEAALGWLGTLAEAFADCFPRVRFMKWGDRGVQYFAGRWARVIMPGPYLVWPLFTDEEVVNVKQQPLDLPQQLLEDKDGVPVIVDGSLVIEIKDVWKFLAETENGYESARDMAAAKLHDIVVTSKKDELQRAPETRVDELTMATRKGVERFGVFVVMARLQTFCKVTPRALYHIGIDAPVPGDDEE